MTYHNKLCDEVFNLANKELNTLNVRNNTILHKIYVIQGPKCLQVVKHRGEGTPFSPA